MNKKWIAVGAIGLLVALPIAFKLARSDSAKEVEIERVSMHALAPSILASGTLTYESQVTLVPEVIGRVREVFVKEGDQVKAGQLLLRLDPGLSLAEVAQIEASKRQSELNIERQRVARDAQVIKWKRYEALRAQGIVDNNTYDDFLLQKNMAEVELNTSMAVLKQTEAQLKLAHERLAKTEVRSPINGKVTAVLIKAGETAVPSATSIAGSQLMTVADTASLYADVNVDETDIAKVTVGQGARIVPAAFPDKSLTGTVEQVALTPRTSPGQSKSYPVKIRLEATSAITFHPGMSCRAEINTRVADGQKTLAVPVQAVKYEQAENENAAPRASVFVLENGKARQRTVTTGMADDSYIEIVRGVKVDEPVIIGPAKTLRFLRQGDAVRVAPNSEIQSQSAAET